MRATGTLATAATSHSLHAATSALRLAVLAVSVLTRVFTSAHVKLRHSLRALSRRLSRALASRPATRLSDRRGARARLVAAATAARLAVAAPATQMATRIDPRPIAARVLAAVEEMRARRREAAEVATLLRRRKARVDPAVAEGVDFAHSASSSSMSSPPRALRGSRYATRAATRVAAAGVSARLASAWGWAPLT